MNVTIDAWQIAPQEVELSRLLEWGPRDAVDRQPSGHESRRIGLAVAIEHDGYACDRKTKSHM